MPLESRAAGIPDGLSPARRYLVFSVADTAYAVEVSRVKRSEPLSGAEEALVVHDRSYPILDARAAFGLPAFSGAGRMLLAVEGERRRAALIVDRILGLQSLGGQAALPLPPLLDGVEREWFEGVAVLDGGIVVLLRVDALLDSRHRGGSARPPAPLALA